jgi:arylsulfatase A-like enzyme
LKAKNMTSKPNILFLLNDHQAHYGHGAMAGGPAIQRPHFDALAAEGIAFQRAHAACPLCGPARRSMLTGLYPHNHGEIKNDREHPFDRETYLDLLAGAGYRNTYYGKWHAGPGTGLDHHCEGFNYPSYNNPYTKPEYLQYLAEQELPAPVIKPVYSFERPKHAFNKALAEGKEYRQDKSWCNEHAAGIMTTPKETQESFFLAHLACKKLEEIAASDSDQPFHLRIDFWGPHQPYFPCQEYADRYDPKAIPRHPSFDDDLADKPDIYKHENNYPISEGNRLTQPSPIPWEDWQQVLALCYAQITMIDEAGGLIIQKLKELGLDENTLIVWGTDHGDNLACHGGHFDKMSYMPEEMLSVPLAMSFPGRVDPGQKRLEWVTNMDIPCTLLDAAGLSFPHRADGASLLKLGSRDNHAWRDDVMCETHGHAEDHLGRIIYHADYKYVFNDGDRDELYDLAADPFERVNLDADPAYADVLVDMKERLARWQDKTDDHPEDPASPWAKLLAARSRT